MDYARTIELDLTYEEAVPKVKEAFKAQGFGTLTEIDVQGTLREKLGKQMGRYAAEAGERIQAALDTLAAA